MCRFGGRSVERFLAATRALCAIAASLVLGWPAGAVAQTLSEFPPPTASSQPFSITTRSDGALWFTDIGQSTIGLTAGVDTEFPASPANSSYSYDGLGQIAAGSDRAVWLPEVNANRIGRIAAVSQPVAINETATISAGQPVTIDTSTGATGNPISAAIVSGPAHGAINVIAGTKVTYTSSVCFTGMDSFQFTLANASGTSNVATATIAVTPPTITTAVYLVDPFLLGQPLNNIDLTQLYKVQNWANVQAKGLLADNASAAIAIIQTTDCNDAVTFTTTNGTTLLQYNSSFLTTPPALGSTSLTIPAATLLNMGGLLYAAVLVQAPIGVPAPSFAASIVVTAQQGNQTIQSQMAMVPPPVLLVHGLWGDQNSLTEVGGVGRYLLNTAPWLNYPGLVLAICYSKYFAFDALNDPLMGADECETTSYDAI